MKLIFRIIFQVAFIITILNGCESDELLNQGLAFYIEQGMTYAEKGQYDKAIAEFSQAIELNPKFAEAYVLRGGAYGEKGQYDKAIADFNQAIELNPKLAEAYHTRALAYTRKHQYDKAISDYTKAIELNPKSAEAYSNRGLVYAILHQYDKSTSDHNKAIEIDPSYDKKAWLEKHEDVLSILKKSFKFIQPEANQDIYTDNAILKQGDSRTGHMHKFKGWKEIENWRKERAKKWSLSAIYPISIEKEADMAHIKCFIFVDDLETGAELIKLSCSAKMLKIGPTWKIKEQIIKNESK